MSPLTQGLNYRSACDGDGGRRQHQSTQAVIMLCRYYESSPDLCGECITAPVGRRLSDEAIRRAPRVCQ